MVKQAIVVIFLLFVLSNTTNAQVVGNDSIFSLVDVMPTWPGCDQEDTDSLKASCFDERIAAFFKAFVVYPRQAKMRKIEGQVIAQFIIEPDGSVTDTKILHDIGYGCGEEVLRVLALLPRLVPGELNHQKVRVVYNIPITFKLK